jgi:hypothetical protein
MSSVNPVFQPVHTMAKHRGQDHVDQDPHKRYTKRKVELGVGNHDRVDALSVLMTSLRPYGFALPNSPILLGIRVGFVTALLAVFQAFPVKPLKMLAEGLSKPGRPI